MLCVLCVRSSCSCFLLPVLCCAVLCCVLCAVCCVGDPTLSSDLPPRGTKNKILKTVAIFIFRQNQVFSL